MVQQGIQPVCDIRKYTQAKSSPASSLVEQRVMSSAMPTGECSGESAGPSASCQGCSSVSYRLNPGASGEPRLAQARAVPEKNLLLFCLLQGMSCFSGSLQLC